MKIFVIAFGLVWGMFFSAMLILAILVGGWIVFGYIEEWMTNPIVEKYTIKFKNTGKVLVFFSTHDLTGFEIMEDGSIRYAFTNKTLAYFLSVSPSDEFECTKVKSSEEEYSQYEVSAMAHKKQVDEKAREIWENVKKR